MQRTSTLSVGDEEGKEDGLDDGIELGSDDAIPFESDVVKEVDKEVDVDVGSDVSVVGEAVVGSCYGEDVGIAEGTFHFVSPFEEGSSHRRFHTPFTSLPTKVRSWMPSTPEIPTFTVS